MVQLDDWYTTSSGSLFKTSDPRCANEVHPESEIGMDGNRQRNLTKICVCPDLEQRERIEENIQHIEWCKAHSDRATKCHICGAIPDTDHPEEMGYTILTTNWHRFLWGNDGYDERLVCEDCYYTNPEYKNCYGIKARRRYLAKKKRMEKRRNEI